MTTDYSSCVKLADSLPLQLVSYSVPSKLWIPAPVPKDNNTKVHVETFKVSTSVCLQNNLLDILCSQQAMGRQRITDIMMLTIY